MRAELKTERFEAYQSANQLMNELTKRDLDHTHFESGGLFYVVWAELEADSPEKQIIEEIIKILSGNEWSPDTPEFIAEVLTEKGYEILEPCEAEG